MTTPTSPEAIASGPPRPAAAEARTGGAAGRIDDVRRIAAGLALILAPLGLLVANTSYAWATRDGGSDSSGADALALAGQQAVCCG